jgi:hypothetical protein
LNSTSVGYGIDSSLSGLETLQGRTQGRRWCANPGLDEGTPFRSAGPKTAAPSVLSECGGANLRRVRAARVT